MANGGVLSVDLMPLRVAEKVVFNLLHAVRILPREVAGGFFIIA